MRNIICFLLVLSCGYFLFAFRATQFHQENSNDLIDIYIDSSKNTNLKFDRRRAYLDKAYSISLKETNDSILNFQLLKLSLAFMKINDLDGFREINRHSIKLSEKLNDSLNLAFNYWDLGPYFNNKGIKDSAFYAYSKAQRIFELAGDDYYSGRMLYNMAKIQSDIKDYTGSEITTTKAISLLKPLKKHKELYLCYNNLAIIYNNLEEYDKAIVNHEIALEYQSNIETKNTHKENTLNNLGVVFKMQQNYKEAASYYLQALKNKKLKDENINLYAKLLDNLAYSQFKLQDTLGVKERFFRALAIRDSLNDHLGIAVNKLHLAEYYYSIEDAELAFKYANECHDLATETNNFRELLPSLLLLSKIDPKNSKTYYDEYIRINDSLQKEERAIRNKFARIAYETDEALDRNVQLSSQNNMILIFASFVILMGTLLYIIKYQRSRNKELFLEQLQQKSNEDIYNLMLSQQQKLDEGRKSEKKRISEELHDGVLGKLFGTRLILGNLNEKNDKETKEKREKYINDLQEIEEEVRNISHELNANAIAKDIGYKEMVLKLLEEQSRLSNFNYALDIDEQINWDSIDGSLKMNLYRIIQEAIHNINKYAQATEVLVKFKKFDDKLMLTIDDNGIGFKTNTKYHGIGINNMKSRVQKFKGKLEIVSIKNRGTTIKILLNI